MRSFGRSLRRAKQLSCWASIETMSIYHEINKFLEECFHVLEAPAPSPEPVKVNEGHALRYKKEHHCLEIAILQKLARYISGLNAFLLLLEAGYTQELGAIFRTLNEKG